MYLFIDIYWNQLVLRFVYLYGLCMDNKQRDFHHHKMCCGSLMTSLCFCFCFFFGDVSLNWTQSWEPLSYEFISKNIFQTHLT